MRCGRCRSGRRSTPLDRARIALDAPAPTQHARIAPPPQPLAVVVLVAAPPSLGERAAEVAMIARAGGGIGISHRCTSGVKVSCARGRDADRPPTPQDVYRASRAELLQSRTRPRVDDG